MLSGRDSNRVWMNYLKGIVAADLYSAVFLSSWLRQAIITRRFTDALEIVDLQKYTVFRRQRDVLIAMQSRAHIPFVFVIGKN